MHLQVVFFAVAEIWLAVSANVGGASESVICETEEVVALSFFGLGIVFEVSVNGHDGRHSEMFS